MAASCLQDDCPQVADAGYCRWPVAFLRLDRLESLELSRHSFLRVPDALHFRVEGRGAVLADVRSAGAMRWDYLRRARAGSGAGFGDQPDEECAWDGRSRSALS